MKPVHYYTLGLFMTFTITGCNHAEQESGIVTIDQAPPTDLTPQHDSLEVPAIDSVIEDGESERKQKTSDDSAELDYFDRYIEFPDDANFNGSPITQQINLSQQLLDQVPDTLGHLAVQRYRSYESFYPKVIACDFENGTSNESIHYPERLLFRFQVFEDEHAEKAYLITTITVIRDHNGLLSFTE